VTTQGCARRPRRHDPLAPSSISIRRARARRDPPKQPRRPYSSSRSS